MHVNSQGKKRRVKSSVLILFLKVDRESADVTLGGRLFQRQPVQITEQWHNVVVLTAEHTSRAASLSTD